MPDDSRPPLDRFLAVFWKDVEAKAVRPLAEYLARFSGDDRAIARECAAILDRTDAGKAATPSVEAAPGRMGHYRIVKEIGRGGQGVVYLAKDESLGRTVALKVLEGVGSASTHALDRFLDEARIASKIERPGVCAVYDTGTERGVSWIAMQFVDGDTLAAKITTAREAGASHTSVVKLPETSRDATTPLRDGPRGSHVPSGRAAEPITNVEVNRVLRVIEEAARILHATHEKGVIHRDVKPGNIMVTPEGEPVILDFGLAKDLEGDLASRTQQGDFFGTPAYMSPEQIAAQRIRLDRRTDVYSLGVTLYECLTLKRPFEAPTRDGLYQAIMTKEPPDPRMLNRDVSSDLRVVLTTALEKDRDRRYQSALDLAEDLRRVRAHEPILAKPVGPVTRLWRWSQRNPALAASLVGLFVVLAAGLGTSLHFLGVSATALGEKGRALEQVTKEQGATKTALGEKAAALGEKTAALNDFHRLWDVSRLEQLTREADALWPADPDKAPAMKAWVGRADALAANLPGHREVVAKLRATALPYSDADKAADVAAHTAEQAKRADVVEEWTNLAAALKAADSRAASRPSADSTSRSASPAEDSLAEIRSAVAKPDAELTELDSKIAERLTWRFESQPVQFKHDTLAKLATDLEGFVDADPHKGTLAGVKARLAFSESVRRETIERCEAKWKEAVSSIAARAQCPKYGGLKIVSQLGLIPIGRDPQSGLWEFAHLQTTAPGVDPVPERGTDGRLVVKETTGLVFVLIPGGTFQMGAIPPDEEHDAGEPNVDPEAQKDEGPVHAVTLAPFFLSKYEMTQGQWLRFAGKNPSQYLPGAKFGDMTVDLRNPVEDVSYEDCDKWLGRLGLLMPTEAQWEYAARAGTATPWWCGDKKASLAKSANLADASCKANGGVLSLTFESWNDGYSVHAPVGSFLPNAFGLHDVLGNVWEWCRDRYGDYEAPLADGDGFRKYAARGFHVVRGGSFVDDASDTRSAHRDKLRPVDRHRSLGVRPARGVSRLDDFTTSPSGK